MSAAPEAFVPLNGSAGNSAPATGGKRHKLKMVTKKQARKLLKKLGKKMRGGAPTDPVPVPAEVEKAAETTEGGRRRRTGKTRRHRKSRSLFGMATPFRRY